MAFKQKFAQQAQLPGDPSDISCVLPLFNFFASVWCKSRDTSARDSLEIAASSSWSRRWLGGLWKALIIVSGKSEATESEWVKGCDRQRAQNTHISLKLRVVCAVINSVSQQWMHQRLVCAQSYHPRAQESATAWEQTELPHTHARLQTAATRVC